MRVLLRIAGIFFLCFALVVGGFFLWFYTGLGLPKLEDLRSLSMALTSQVFASDGTLVAELHGEINREYVPLEEISPYLRDAVVAIEDERFYQHKGVDWVAIARAFWTNVVQGKLVQGASTITQQFIKNTLTGRERTYWRKVQEASLAFQLERKYTKEKILEMYLNDVYFGQGCYGAKKASETFFGKPPSELTLEEAALLAGVIRIPNHYSPYVNPEAARARRNVVLDKMAELGYITREQAEAAKAKPVTVRKIPEKPPSTVAPYFVEYVKKSLYNLFAGNDRLRARFGNLSPDDIIFRGGLRVYTTLDLRMQDYAEKAISSTLNRPNDPSAALVAVDPRTGEIKAMVGGKDFTEQQYNIAAQGGRQPGSAFKVFVLTAALNMGISPHKTYDSTPTTLTLPDGTKWKVSNAGGGSYGTIDLYTATVRSVNVVFARLIMDVGPNRVIQIASSMGIKSPLEPRYAIALGGLTHGVNPLEMASAFGTLATGGLRVEPTAITRITDYEGNVIYEHDPKPVRVLREDLAQTVNKILQDAVNYGTGREARIGRPQAGKTGTTDNFTDAWFVGYTPDLSAAVWVGYPQGLIPMRNVHGITVYGGTFPAQIWRKFMEKALADVPPTDFTQAKPKTEESSEYVTVRICSESGKLATPYCPRTETRTFRRGEEPTEYCDVHTEQGAMVRVPAVVGMTEAGATAALQEAGLKVSVNYVYTSQYPAGTVVDQSPMGGAAVKEGTVVYITVSKGVRPKAVVPNVVGMTEEQARQALQAEGFSCRVVYVPKNESLKGIVVSQFPGAGTELGPGSQVIITVGS